VLFATAIVLGYVVAALLLSWAFFARGRMTRPPLGVFNLADIAIMLGAIVAVPYLYLVVPHWLVAGLLGLGALSSLYLTGEVFLPTRAATWFVSLTLVGADVGALLAFGPGSMPFFLVNNLVLVVVGTTNLWAQAGMRARDAAVLAVYDVVATTQLP
jgi:hypothetical protein